MRSSLIDLGCCKVDDWSQPWTFDLKLPPRPSKSRESYIAVKICKQLVMTLAIIISKVQPYPTSSGEVQSRTYGLWAKVDLLKRTEQTEAIFSTVEICMLACFNFSWVSLIPRNKARLLYTTFHFYSELFCWFTRSQHESFNALCLVTRF